jgi:hypothetical protein
MARLSRRADGKGFNAAEIEQTPDGTRLSDKFYDRSIKLHDVFRRKNTDVAHDECVRMQE